MNQSPESKIMTNILEEMKQFFKFSPANKVEELTHTFTFLIPFNKITPGLSTVGFKPREITFRIDAKNKIIYCLNEKFKYPIQLEKLFKHIKDVHKLT